MKDSEFIRGSVPMTKGEIRTIVLSKLELNSTDSFMDIGAGTGSVSIEAAKLVTSGIVIAIEHNSDAIELINKNIEKHSVSNINVIQATAPNGMESVSSVNKFFIGGSGGNINDILKLIDTKAPNNAIVVVTAIVIDTMYQTYRFMKEHNYNFELIQVAVSSVNTQTEVPMLTARNPIFIITGKKQ